MERYRPVSYTHLDVYKRQKLTSEHYTVDACYSGDEALDFLRCAEYDGVILDIMLPGITGLGVLLSLIHI